MPDVVQVPSDDTEALAVLMADRAGEIAAVITEPVQGAGGVFPPVEGYLDDLRRLCDRHGALLVFDEVITGFGRLGHWFAADRYGVVPDLTTFAKAVTSGYQPLGGVFVGPAVRGPLEADPGLHPAPRLHVLGPPRGVRRRRWPTWRSSSARGWWRGPGRSVPDSAPGSRRWPPTASSTTPAATARCGRPACAPDQDAMAIRDRMLAGGVITRAIGTDTLTFCPPLVITEEQVDRIVDVLATASG